MPQQQQHVQSGSWRPERAGVVEKHYAKQELHGADRMPSVLVIWVTEPNEFTFLGNTVTRVVELAALDRLVSLDEVVLDRDFLDSVPKILSQSRWSHRRSLGPTRECSRSRYSYNEANCLVFNVIFRAIISILEKSAVDSSSARRIFAIANMASVRIGELLGQAESGGRGKRSIAREECGRGLALVSEPSVRWRPGESHRTLLGP